MKRWTERWLWLAALAVTNLSTFAVTDYLNHLQRST
jgi:hypothetical protein